MRFRTPRRGSLLRLTLVAALLTLAAGLLFLGPSAGSANCREVSAPDDSTAASPQRATPDPESPEAGGGPRPDPSVPGHAGSGSGDQIPVPDGAVGVPIQLAEPATAAVVRVGDRVDVIARSSGPGRKDSVLVTNALVLAVNSAADGSWDEGVLFLAAAPSQAQRLARTAPDIALGITVRP
ncbi:MAG: hypothetical protein ACRDT8_12950 [Micromonosporaceae bacterium]